MKKFLCFFVAAVIMTAQCAVYAETNANTNDESGNNIELFAMPRDQIVGADRPFEQDELNAVNDAMHDALEDADKAENEYAEIAMPVDIDTSDENRINAMFGIVVNYLENNPKYFYLNQLDMRYDPNTKSIKIGYKEKYKLDGEEIQNTQSRIDETVSDILMQMKNDGINPYGITYGTAEEKQQSDFDRALWLHDYLADTITYDNRAYSTVPEEIALIERTIDAALLDRLTVCQGYANAYKYILEKIGMECVNVYSDAEMHEWSAVKIGDKWYYVDVTQDDHDGYKNIKHDFFLVTKKELEADIEHQEDPANRNLENHGTHHYGYITEIELNDDDFGTDYEGAPWHANWDDEPESKWHLGVANTRVVFDGDDRYYCSFDADEENCSFVYKCDAGMNNSEKLCRIEDGRWYVNKKTENPRRFYQAYFGGLGKYTYADTNDDEKHSGKTFLYFNSQNAIYELCLDEENASAEVVFEYKQDDESENVDCMFGISVYDVIEYLPGYMNSAGVIATADNTEALENTIACNVRFYVTVDTLLLSGILTYPYGTSINAPGSEMYGKIVKLTDLSDDSVWEYGTPITESVKLCYEIESIKWPRTSLRVSADRRFIGGLDAGIDSFDEAYCEAPVYTLAVYEGGTLKAVKIREDGKFTFTADENIPYKTGSTEVKIYAWNSSLMPYLDGAKVHISLPSGEDEGGNEEDNNEEDNEEDTDTPDSE